MLVLIDNYDSFTFNLYQYLSEMGADVEVFRSVDALYTAITARNEKLLSDCEKRLNEHKNAGRLPSSAASHLDGIVATARAGRWQPAAERLHAFMSVQRRKS